MIGDGEQKTINQSVMDNKFRTLEGRHVINKAKCCLFRTWIAGFLLVDMALLKLLNCNHSSLTRILDLTP